jgi:transcriptional regulator with PAS, ATPase and Fis domain
MPLRCSQALENDTVTNHYKVGSISRVPRDVRIIAASNKDLDEE